MSSKYSTGNDAETRKQWNADERLILFEWTCKPFVSVSKRHREVECRLVVEYNHGVGLDVLLQARSEDTPKIADDYETVVSVEGRDGYATYSRQENARWVQ